jgi:hypothetical protein
MLILRAVTATDMPADQADPKVNPSVAHRQTLLATFRARRNVHDLVQVRTFHGY